MSKRIFKIEFNGSGGEYALGKVTDKEEWSRLVELNEDGELSTDNEYEDDEGDYIELSFNNYTSVLYADGHILSDLHVNIKEIDSSNIYKAKTIKEIELPEDYEPTNFSKANPCIDPKKVDKDTLGFFGGIKYHNGNLYSYILETEEDIDVNKIRVLTMNMDETLSGDEVITDVLYMSDKDIYEIVKAVDADALEDLEDEDLTIEEVLHETETLYKIYEKDNSLEILQKYMLQPEGGDTDFESDKVTLFNKNGNRIG
jgi:hypothetical protein